MHRQGQSAPALRVRGQGERRHHGETFRPGGQFVTHAAALPGNPYDGHTLGTVIPQMQALIGNVLDRCITDAGYRGHNAPPDHKFKVYTTGQKRRLTPQIKREFKRRAAIEPVIGHLKENHRMGRNLPRPCQRRCHQRRARRRGVQLATTPHMVEAFVAPNPDRPRPFRLAQIGLKT